MQPGCPLPLLRRFLTVCGRLLVLEGIDGSGKTTQLERLAAWLPGSGLMPAGADLVVTREPGGTVLGEELRRLLLKPPQGAAPCNRAELLLYAADRAQHVERLIKPALQAGNWVLSDRFSGATEAYQGHGRGLDLATIRQLERMATAGLEPDITLWLDLPLADSIRRRRRQRADRMEAAGSAFLERVHGGFAALATEQGWCRVDATRSVEAVAADISVALRGRLG